MGAQVTTNIPLTISRFSPYLSRSLLNTAAVFSLLSSRSKLTAINTADATNYANVNAASAKVTPDAIPESDVVTQMANNMKSHNLPKLNISFSFVPSVRRNVQKKLRKNMVIPTRTGPTHNMKWLVQSLYTPVQDWSHPSGNSKTPFSIEKHVSSCVEFIPPLRQLGYSS